MAQDLARASKSVMTTLVIRDPKGKEAARYKVEVFLDREKDLFGVRFAEGEIMKGMVAHLPAGAALDAVRKKNGR